MGRRTADEKQARRVDVGVLIGCAAAVALLLLLLYSCVRLCELGEWEAALLQEKETLETQLSQLDTQWNALSAPELLRRRAEELGLRQLEDGDIVVLHIGHGAE